MPTSEIIVNLFVGALATAGATTTVRVGGGQCLAAIKFI